MTKKQDDKDENQWNCEVQRLKGGEWSYLVGSVVTTQEIKVERGLRL